jgi:penicillin-binding protein 1A
MDRHWRITLVTALAATLLSALTFAPIVRSIATRKAAARGLELSVEHVRPGLLSVHLSAVKLGLEGTSAVRATLRSVEVRVTPWLSLSGVVVDGGEIAIEGTPDTLREQLSAWRERHRGQSTEGGGRGRGALPIVAERIDAVWTGIEPDAPPQTISGIAFERNDDGALAEFAAARVESHLGAISASGAKATFTTTEHGLALATANVEQVIGRVSLGGGEGPSPTTTAAVAPEPAAPAASDPDDDEEVDDLEDDEPAAAHDPKAAPGQKRLADRLAPLAAESWPRRREQLTRLRQVLGVRLGDRARLEVAKVQLEVAHGPSVLNVGPAPFEVRREGAVVSASFLPPAEKGGKRIAMNARLPLDEGPVELSLEGGPISLQTLGVREGDFGLLGVSDSALTVQTHVELSPAGTLSIAASGRAEHLALEQAALAPEPLRDVDINWSGQVQLDLGQRKFTLDSAVLGLEDVHVNLAGSIEAVEDDVRVALSVEVPKTSCQDMLTAAPAALLPQLGGLRLGGTFALHSRVALDTSDPKNTEVEWELDNRCKVLETPEDIDPKRFREPFQHYVVEPDGRATEFTTGPTTPLWVPLSEINPAVETGLIVCEDSRFFKHDGFDNKAIRDSILSNLKKGHFVRGASTLSMQLAKNLYLGREKTLSRKLQEAAFTLLLEERLSKEDILELYLNVVEFGPGVYGIRNGAQYYFNSHPGELSLAQAMFLASILPNPKAKRFAEDGSLKPRWAKHLKYLMRVAHKIKRISDEELEAGTNEALRFGQAQPETKSDFLFGTPLYDVQTE